MKTFHTQWEALQKELGGVLTAHYHRGLFARREAIARAVRALQAVDEAEPHDPHPMHPNGPTGHGDLCHSDADPGL